MFRKLVAFLVLLMMVSCSAAMFINSATQITQVAFATFENQTARTSATGSGSTGQAIPFSFPISSTSDIVCYKRVTATGVETTLTETTDYTVSINGDSGGTVTTVTAIASTAEIHIVRRTPKTQTLNLTQGGVFSAERVEDAFDKQTRIAIDAHDKADRALRFPETDPTSSITTLPSSVDRADGFLYFDTDGVPTVVTDANYTGYSSVTTLGDIINAKEYLHLDHVVDVRDYGAIAGDGIDDTNAFNDALDALPSTGGTVFAPAGVYTFSKTAQADQFTIDKSNVTFRGEGPGTILNLTYSGTVTGNQAVVQVFPNNSVDVNCIILRDFRVIGPSTNTGAVIPGDTRILGIAIADGVSEQDINDVWIDRVIIEGMEIAAFGLNGCGGTKGVKNVWITNCIARYGRQDGYNDFGGGRNENINIINCIAEQLDGFGFEMSSSKGMLLAGNTIRNTGQAAIGIEYNNVYSPDQRVVIIGNKIQDIATTGYPTSEGISLGQAQTPVHTDIIGNSIWRVGGKGISLNGSPNDITISDNIVVDVGGGSASSAITSTGSVLNTTVKNNIIRNISSGYSMTYGVALSGTGSATNHVEGNVVSGFSVAGISANSPTVLINSRKTLVDRVSVGNVGAGEDDLIDVNVPGYTLDRDGTSTVRITAYGTTAANANNKTVKLYWKGAEIASTGALAANDKDWKLTAIVTRINSSTAQSYADGIANDALVSPNYISGIGGHDWTSDITVKCTGEATADNDIVQSFLMVEAIN